MRVFHNLFLFWLLKLALHLRALGPAVATGTSVKEREGA